MKCGFRKKDIRMRAFTLVEVSAALIILGIVSSSVVLVISRCVASGTNSMLRMQAFEVARENMEKLLASDVLEETADYGQSELYPGTEWETTVETFYEPITARMWVRGVSLARYYDIEQQEQTVELTHWLTDVTKDQLLKMMNDPNSAGELFSEQLIESVDEAAAYAEVDVETIERWLDNGMEVTDDGSFVKGNLDIYKAANGDPSPEDRQRQISSTAEFEAEQRESGNINTGGGQQGADEIDPKTGLTYRELEQMDFPDVYNLIKERRR
jgi:prepilin-type N-terminal cleavage/methylation domain-containing protein